jgi:hypothetical protein
MFDGVTEGTRTPDIRDHNPALYQLSYDHHPRMHHARNHDSHAPAAGGQRVIRSPSPSVRFYRMGRFAEISAAIALAASTSGPGWATKTVRR